MLRRSGSTATSAAAPSDGERLEDFGGKRELRRRVLKGQPRMQRQWSASRDAGL